MLPVRGTSTRKAPVLGLLSDGSYLSDLDALEVRIIEADLAVTHGHPLAVHLVRYCRSSSTRPRDRSSKLVILPPHCRATAALRSPGYACRVLGSGPVP